MRKTPEQLEPNVNCARCNKPVDKIERYYDFDKSETVFTIVCHGQKEVIRIPRYRVSSSSVLSAGEYFPQTKE